MDTAVGADERRQRVGVGTAELLDLPVAQQVFDDRVVVGHLLEGVGVGRRSGLRLLDRREPELLEQHDPELRRGVDVELLARVTPDALHQRVAFLVQLGAQLLEECPVDADPGELHLGEHPDERTLEPFVEIGEVTGLERLGQHVGEPQHRDRSATRLVDTRAAVEVERPLFDVGRRDLQREVPQGQVLEPVLPFRGIEQVRHHRGVVVQRAHVGVQPVHELLGAVRDQRRPTGADEFLRARPTPRRRATSAPSTYATRPDAVGERQPDDLTLTRRTVPSRFERDRCFRPPRPSRTRATTGLGIAQDLDVRVELFGGRLRGGDLSDGLHHAGQQRPELELVEQDADPLRVERTLPEVVDLGAAVDVSAQQRHLAVQQHPITHLAEVLALLRREVVEMIENRLDRPVRRHELRGGLLPDARARRAGCRSGRREAPRTPGTAPE